MILETRFLSRLIIYDPITLTDCPSRKDLMFPTTTSRRRILDSLVAHAMCGVIKQFLALKSGFPAGGGSIGNTSIPAPLIRSSFSAFANADASTKPPREVLMIIAEGFIIARDSTLMRFSV